MYVQGDKSFDTCESQKCKRNIIMQIMDCKLTADESKSTQYLYHFGYSKVLQLLDIITYSSTPGPIEELYLVTEYVDFTLQQIIHGNVLKKHLNHEEISYFVYQMLCGLQHLHKANIIHRVRMIM